LSHQTISFIKSGIRIAGYVALLGPQPSHLYIAAGLLVLSELVGIAEEIGH
jgi:hypothetical protein